MSRKNGVIFIQRHRAYTILNFGNFGFHNAGSIPFLAFKQLDLYLITIGIGKGSSTIMEVIEYQFVITTYIVSVVDIERCICQNKFHRNAMGIRSNTLTISVHTTCTTSTACTRRSKCKLAVSDGSTRRHTDLVILRGSTILVILG